MPKYLGSVAFVKIWAVGCDKRYVWFYFLDDTKKEIHCIRVGQKFYNYLYNKGVPTSQSMRYQKYEG